MAARIDLSSAGVSLQYAVETTGGERPTTGYTRFSGIKSIPDLDPEPSSLDTTTLDEEYWRRSIPGLRDPGGILGFGANNTEVFQTEWEELVEKAQAAHESQLAMWFAVVIPGLTKAFYFSGTPSPLGLGAIEVDSVLEINAYISPEEIVGWDTKPTEVTV